MTTTQSLPTSHSRPYRLSGGFTPISGGRIARAVRKAAAHIRTFWCELFTPLPSAAIAAAVIFASPAGAAPVERVVLTSIDGLTASDAMRLEELADEAPTLNSLIREGVRAEGVRPTTPANTFPNHVTMVTGVSAATHGIFDNDRFAPGTDRHGLFFHYASDIRVPTLFDAARNHDLRTMAIWWPVTTGAYIDQLLADVPGDVRERGKYVFASASPNIRRTLGSPARAAEMTDDLRLDAAIAGLEGRPDFMAIHFTELDSAQHNHEASSPEIMAALARTDRRVSRFLEALAAEGLSDGTTIVVASDHGFSPLHSAVFPGRLFRAYGLLAVDGDGAVESWQAYPWPGGGALAIYINPEAEDERAIRQTVDQLIDIMAGHPAGFVENVYRGEAMSRWGGYPDAYALLNAASGYAFGGDLDSMLVRSGTRTKGVHGFVPDGEYMYGALILSGAGVDTAGHLEVVRMEDIAPTIAHLLGLPLPEAQGRVLGEALAGE